jgi:hypothetical protein
MSNLTAGPAEHAAAIVSHPSVIQVIVHMLSAETYDIKREVDQFSFKVPITLIFL